jgi:hypothetical protein
VSRRTLARPEEVLRHKRERAGAPYHRCTGPVAPPRFPGRRRKFCFRVTNQAACCRLRGLTATLRTLASEALQDAGFHFEFGRGPRDIGDSNALRARILAPKFGDRLADESSFEHKT